MSGMRIFFLFFGGDGHGSHYFTLDKIIKFCVIYKRPCSLFCNNFKVGFIMGVGGFYFRFRE